MSQHIQTHVEAGVLTVRLDRPEKKNAIDRAMYAAMSDALDDASDDASVGAVLIAGAPGAFSSGNDIKDFLAFAQGAGEGMGEVTRFLISLVRCEKPLVAAVDGLAIGVGTTLLMHCDLVYATPASLFRTPFIDLGLVPEASSSLIAPRMMGHQRAFALLALGETFDAQTAKVAGLVYDVSQEAEAMAIEAARRLAGKPPEALAIARALIRGDRAEVEARIRLESDHFAKRLRSREASAAFAAFMSRN